MTTRCGRKPYRPIAFKNTFILYMYMNEANLYYAVPEDELRGEMMGRVLFLITGVGDTIHTPDESIFFFFSNRNILNAPIIVTLPF